MTRICCILFLLTGRLYAQDLDLRLDTTIHPATFYHKRYALSKAGVNGEGWELSKTSKLLHAFYGDSPGNPFYKYGSWAIANDSITFNVKDKKLINKYGYSGRQVFKPFSISWDLKTDYRKKGEETKLLVLKNRMIILNKNMDPNAIINQLRAHLESKMEKLKTEADADVFELNRMILSEVRSVLYDKKLFASYETFNELE
jgi:hypothetical protein